MTRIGVVTFPGTLDDRDAARAVEIAGAQAVSLWHKDADLHGVDAVVIPGGFSYGDYLRCGAIAATAPVMSEIVREAGRGLPVLGMPHPEHATEAGFGPLSLGPDGASHHGGTDGLGIFRSVLASLVG